MAAHPPAVTANAVIATPNIEIRTEHGQTEGYVLTSSTNQLVKGFW